MAIAKARIVFLVGFMGAGKTSVGQALSRHLQWKFDDLDDLIQARTGQAIEQIFRDHGERYFRDAERSALRDLLDRGPSQELIVAVGGGAFAETETGAMLEESGHKVVFLDAPVEEMWRRCCQQSMERPLCRDFDQFSALYRARYPYYLRAGLRVETGGKPIETIAVEIATRLGLG